MDYDITCHILQPSREEGTFLTPPNFHEVELVQQQIECPPHLQYLEFLFLDIDNRLHRDYVSAK